MSNDVFDDYKKRQEARKADPQGFQAALNAKREQLLNSLRGTTEHVEAFIRQTEEGIVEGEFTATGTEDKQPVDDSAQTTTSYHELLEGFLRLTNKVLELEERILALEKPSEEDTSTTVEEIQQAFGQTDQQ